MSDRGVASGFGVAADVGLLIFAALLLCTTTKTNVVVKLGTFLMFAALFGPAAWPWYFIWGLALLAGDGRAQRSVALAALIVVSVFLIKPDGILALPVGSSPIVLAVYLVLAGARIAWSRRAHGDSDRREKENEVFAVAAETR